MPSRVCIFCGSSSGSRESYTEAARELAQHLARHKIGIVYGGGKVGLMGELANAALAAAGEVIGVMPRSLVKKEIAHTRLSSLRVVDSTHERKALMAGHGTIEEFCEVLTWTQLGLQRKPCGILNVDGSYNQLLALFDQAVSEQFLKPVHRQLVLSDSRPDALVTRLLGYEPPLVEKWLDLKQQ